MNRETAIRIAAKMISVEETLTEGFLSDPDPAKVWTPERAYRRGVEDALLVVGSAHLAKESGESSDAIAEDLALVLIERRRAAGMGDL